MNNDIIVYVTRDGDERFSGATATEVVDAMRRASVNEEATTEKYLHAAADRYSRFDNVIVRADCAENFLADLEAAGILKRVMS